MPGRGRRRMKISAGEAGEQYVEECSESEGLPSEGNGQLC